MYREKAAMPSSHNRGDPKVHRITASIRSFFGDRFFSSRSCDNFLPKLPRSMAMGTRDLLPFRFVDAVGRYLRVLVRKNAPDTGDKRLELIGRRGFGGAAITRRGPG